MKYSWEERGGKFLKKSLGKPAQELNELDWKVDISEKGERVARHISAFANYSDGGFMVFGVNDEGKKIGLNLAECTRITSKIGSMVRESVDPPVTAEASVVKIDGVSLLFVYISESEAKPVHLRGGTIYDSYTRNAGQTRKLTNQEAARLISNSTEQTFETNFASKPLTIREVRKYLDYLEYFHLLNLSVPSSDEEIMEVLCTEKLLKKSGDKYRITNLGAITFARDISLFPNLSRKAIRVVQYLGKDKLHRVRETIGQKGYAIGFANIVKFINRTLPSKEVIRGAIRREVQLYPELSIRELVANALIHQDFGVVGTSPVVEIFSDRVEISDPGRPLVKTERFLDNPPRSRNEGLAALMRRFGICEESGTGIDKIVKQCEEYELPAPRFDVNDDHLTATIFGPRSLTKMDKEDRIRACYLHASLKQVSHDVVTNASIRERFKISKKNYPFASKILKESVEAGYIKPKNKSSKSRKHAQYVPFWA
jgi:ATP-dependent DNA helicase RecG